MRIHVVCFTGNSGITHYSASLCRGLARYSEVTLVTATSFDDDLVRSEFTVAKLFRRARHWPIDIVQYIRYTLRTKPDVVIFQSVLKFPLFESWIVRLFRAAGIRTVATVHDTLPHHMQLWSRWIYSRYYDSFDRLVVHSARSHEDISHMVSPTKPIRVMPHGVYDIFNTRNTTRAEANASFPGLVSDNFVFLFFGEIDERKGVLEFIEAAEQFTSNENAKFVIAGRRMERRIGRELNQRLETIRRDPRYIVHDTYIPFDRVQDYFARADVVVLPYREGTTSGVLKLAMAFQKPVISTRVGDIPETTHDWGAILISDSGIVSQLANAMKAASRDYGLLENACKLVSSKYAWETISRQYFIFSTET